ncbi:MAG: hypothetical protein ACYDGR_01395 [Candidatus Dormibacteria bacterium]
MRIRSADEVRVPAEILEPVSSPHPELLAPLARAIHNSHCPACGANVIGFDDVDESGATRVQITCFGVPGHAFFFDSVGHVDWVPALMGTLPEGA